MFRRANSAESSTRAAPETGLVAPPAPVEVVGQSSGNNNNNNNNGSGYICSLCSRVFASTHALGGHQNAHRKQRSEERALYIAQRLEHNKILAGSASPPPEQRPKARVSGGSGAGPSNKRARVVAGAGDGQDGQAENVSLELTLAVGGSARARPVMAYNYPDVLFPASEFREMNVDLDLKL